MSFKWNDVEVEIKNPKFTCTKCGKSFYHFYIETFPFRGDIICVCRECADKIQKFIREKEN